MELALVVVVLIVLLWIRQYRYARKILALRARQLSVETGIPVDDIEREILHRRITPGDWAREHGLDPLTLRRAERTSGGLFAERELLEPDWAEVTDLFAGDERRISCSSGWTVSLTDPISHPVSLYLTDAALYVSIRPETLLPDAAVRRWTKAHVASCDAVRQADGGTRLMMAFESLSSQGAPPVMLAVDLRPLSRGRSFAENVCGWFEGRPSTWDAESSRASRPAPARPARRKGRLPSRLDES